MIPLGNFVSTPRGLHAEDRFFSCVAVAGPWPGGRGRMAVAGWGGRVVCMWSGWRAGRVAVAVAGRPAWWPVAVCMWSGGRLAGWPWPWPDGRVAVCVWSGGRLAGWPGFGRMAGPCPNCAGPGLNQG